MKIKNKTLSGYSEELPVHHLVPYMMAVGASFIFYLPREPSPGRISLKCLPILYLIAYLGATERGKGESGKIILALMFSLIGDVFMVYPDSWILHGLMAFAIAQTFYISAFGFKSIRVSLGIILYAVGFMLLFFVLPHIPAPLNVAIPIYNLLIGTMFWRALDRYTLMPHLCFERRLCSALGAVFFIVSDISIVFLQMLKLVPHIPSQIIVLSTYYSAQLLLMLGSADSFWASKKLPTKVINRNKTSNKKKR